MKVANIRCHVGAQIGAQVFTSLDSKVNKCTMMYTTQGVFITGMINGVKISPHLIPLSTIASIRFEQEEFEKAFPSLEVAPKEVKRSPGRPAKEAQPEQ